MLASVARSAISNWRPERHLQFAPLSCDGSRNRARILNVEKSATVGMLSSAVVHPTWNFKHESLLGCGEPWNSAFDGKASGKRNHDVIIHVYTQTSAHGHGHGQARHHPWPKLPIHPCSSALIPASHQPRFRRTLLAPLTSTSSSVYTTGSQPLNLYHTLHCLLIMLSGVPELYRDLSTPGTSWFQGDDIACNVHT